MSRYACFYPPVLDDEGRGYWVMFTERGKLIFYDIHIVMTEDKKLNIWVWQELPDREWELMSEVPPDLVLDALLEVKACLLCECMSAFIERKSYRREGLFLRKIERKIEEMREILKEEGRVRVG